MAAYHVVMIHFPIALWLVSSLAIVIRAFNSNPLGLAMDRALPVFLILGVIFGAAAYALGLLIWPWETLSSTPMGRNHMLVASWSFAYYALLAVIRHLHGDAIWTGLSRWVMVVLAGIGAVLVGITGTLGGHLIGNYTEVGEVLRLLGWEIYSTYYLPNLTLIVIAVAAAVLVALGFVGRGKAQA